MKRLEIILTTTLLAVMLLTSRAGSIEVKTKAKATTASSPGDTSQPVPSAAPAAPPLRGLAPESASAPSDKGQAAEKGTPDRSSKKSLLERLKRKVREAQKEERKPEYDHLIDADNDGVDDRVKTAPPTTSSAKPVERKPRSDSTRKTPPR